MDQTIYLTCPQCPGKYPATQFTECPACNVTLNIPDNPLPVSQQTNGNHSPATQIIGDGNVFEQKIFVPSNEDKTTFIHRSSIQPLTIANTPIKSWWFIVSGALGLTGSLASIVGTWVTMADKGIIQTSSHALPMWVTITSMLLLLTGAIFQRSKYITLFFGRTIEKDKENNLYITRIEGECGLCKHPVKVKTIGSKEARQTVVMCTNNPDQHRWPFDPTVPGDVGEDYREQLAKDNKKRG